eukprot:gene7993-5553_t
MRESLFPMNVIVPNPLSCSTHFSTHFFSSFFFVCLFLMQIYIYIYLSKPPLQKERGDRGSESVTHTAQTARTMLRRSRARLTMTLEAASVRGAPSLPPAAAPPSSSPAAASGWSPQQQSYRRLLKALRGAYYHDRAKLFWARHRVLLEFYKYAAVELDTAADGGPGEKVLLLLGISDEVAEFIRTYMKTDVGRIVRHNEKLLSLPVVEAKRLRDEYFLAEKQHESWCKQRIREMLQRRPPPPYPFS